MTPKPHTESLFSASSVAQDQRLEATAAERVRVTGRLSAGVAARRFWSGLGFFVDESHTSTYQGVTP